MIRLYLKQFIDCEENYNRCADMSQLITNSYHWRVLTKKYIAQMNHDQNWTWYNLYIHITHGEEDSSHVTYIEYPPPLYWSIAVRSSQCTPHSTNLTVFIHSRFCTFKSTFHWSKSQCQHQCSQAGLITL